MQPRVRRTWQLLNFRFEHGNTSIALGQDGEDVNGIDALRDMLQAVGAPGAYREEHHALRPCLVPRRHQLRREGLITLDGAQLAPDFESSPTGIVNQEEMGFRIFANVTKRDVLPIASVIDETDGRFIDHAQETRRASPVLNVGLAGSVGGRQENPGLIFDEGFELRRD
jgi:hypothetical protein